MTNILIISHTLIPSVLLCGHSQLEYLKKQNKIDYKFSQAHLVTTEILSWSDIIIFLRSESELEAYVSDLCKKANKHLIYILDDDLLNAPDYLSSSSYYNRPDIQRNIKHVMANCTTFLTSSFVMLEKYGKQFKNAFQIHEPSLNVIDKKQPNNKVKIGFAGSIDRAQDINQILEESLTKIINKYQDQIEIEFMGAKPDTVDRFNLTYIPYKDSYEKYTETIKERNWDIGLAPMPDTEFHNCKYFNKYVEYASFGIAGIYSNVKPYTFGIKDSFNGLLVDNNTTDWFNSISKLIEDNTLRTTISNNCLNEAKTIYSLETLADDYLEKVLVDFKETDEHTININKKRYYLKKSQLRTELYEYKWKFPFWFIKKTFLNSPLYTLVLIAKEQGFNFPIWAINRIKRFFIEKK